MFKRLGLRGGGRRDAAPSPAATMDPARAVRSVEDAYRLFDAAGHLDSHGLTADGRATVAALVQALRRDGLGMEPNLIGRAGARVGGPARECGSLAVLLAGADGDFVAIRSEADAARDNGAFDRASDLYETALAMYPHHFEVMVQLGHSRKEMGHLPPALVAYLDAGTLGAARRDIEDHMLFVAERIGRLDGTRQFIAKLKDPQASGALMSTDVTTLVQLLHGRTPDTDEILKHLLSKSDNTSLVRQLIGEPSFAQMHRSLLLLIAQKQI